MKLPFFYPEHPEFKKHVEYVAKEMWRFHNDVDDLKFPYKVAEAGAKEIVLWVGSRPVPWWERLIDALRGNQGRVIDDMFEAGLEKWLKESIERAKPDWFNLTDEERHAMELIDEEAVGRDFDAIVDLYVRRLNRELGFDIAQASVDDKRDQPISNSQ